MTAALFRQHTSRTMDPQLHTHAVIGAKVQDPTGKWLSLDAGFLKHQQRSISWLYAAALRSELTARLGVAWGPMTEGHAEIEGVPAGLVELFSKRTAQVEAALAKRIARWVDEHDGDEPDARTIARLERKAVLASRPDKEAAIEADTLRAQWLSAARTAGFEPVSLASQQRQLPGTTAWDDEAVMAEALERAATSSSTWLEADLAREIAALVPADAISSAGDLVAFVDELAERAASRCVALHPRAAGRVSRRKDGRPVTEHVTNRRLSSRAVLAQEARLLTWARSSVGTPPPAAGPARDAQAAAARSVSGDARLVLIVGPAGAGKTTTLRSAVAALRQQRRAVIGLAPSGKAADVLARETGSPATTLAKLLYEHARPDGPSPEWQVPAGATVILDEAGMAATADLDRLVALVEAQRWRLVCVGDPAQLPAVGRGGVFALWSDKLHAHHLDEVRRFTEAWQAEASLALRRGEAAAARVYTAHGRLRSTHPALVADRVARQYQKLAARGDTVAITTASAGTARAINVEIQRRGNPRPDGRSITLADGTRVFVGDQVATRRNDASLITSTGGGVRNRHTWTVTAVGGDGSVTVADGERGSVRLPGDYVARHVELGWAVTGYGSQGVTVDHGICVIEASSSRAGIYVGMTRGRGRNIAWLLDPTGLSEAEEAFAVAIGRPANALTAHAVREQLYRAWGEVVVDDPAARMAERLAQLQVAKRPVRALER